MKRDHLSRSTIKRTAMAIALALTLAQVLVYLGVSGIAWATDPGGNSVTITPVGAGATDVWGEDETISYLAQCAESCAADHNCHFTNTQGLNTVVSCSATQVQISGTKKASATAFQLAAECKGQGFDHGNATRSFRVVKVTALTVTGASLGTDGKYYADAASAGDIIITATLTGGVTTGLRNGFMVWTGGTARATQLERQVSKASNGETEVKCRAGAAGPELSVTVVVVGLTPAFGHGFYLWFFNGAQPANYDTGMSLSLSGLGGSVDVTWTVTAGTEFVAFDHAGGPDSIVWSSQLPILVISEGASLNQNDVTITASASGVVVATHTFTVMAPQHCVLRNVYPYSNPYDYPVPTAGFGSKYSLRTTDMFNGVMPRAVEGNESCHLPWESDDPGECWKDPTMVGFTTYTTGLAAR